MNHKQIGNLAIACALRNDVLCTIFNGDVSIMLDGDPKKIFISAKWDDDEKISEIIKELNYGKYRI